MVEDETHENYGKVRYFSFLGEFCVAAGRNDYEVELRQVKTTRGAYESDDKEL
jgi:hypothetical protein